MQGFRNAAKEKLEIVSGAAHFDLVRLRSPRIAQYEPPQAAKCAVPRSKLYFTTGIRINSKILQYKKETDPTRGVNRFRKLKARNNFSKHCGGELAWFVNDPSLRGLLTMASRDKQTAPLGRFMRVPKN